MTAIQSESSRSSPHGSSPGIFENERAGRRKRANKPHLLIGAVRFDSSESGIQVLNMSVESLSPELRAFIAEYVHSVEQLEILCLLFEGSAKAWTPGEILRIVQSSLKSVINCLESFRKNGLLISLSPGAYEFSPRKQEINRVVLELAKAYHERRVTVIESIYQRSGDTIQDFADAFKLRKDKR